MSAAPVRSIRRIGIGLVLLGALIGLAAIAMLQPIRPAAFDEVRARYVSSDAYLLDRHGTVLGTQRKDFNVRRMAWTPIEAISPAMVAAVVQGEDRRFWSHRGVDWISVAGAARDQLLRGRRGASTLTMQLASLLASPTRPRSGTHDWREKREQARLALGLEQHWSKGEILEAYLNLVQFRGELQGIRAAAVVLAGKEPSGLSGPESAVLAALLPNPTTGPERVAARACARAVAAATGCDQIREAARAMLSPPRDGVTEEGLAPQLAPQLAQALLKGPGERVTTTLDAGIQRLARDALGRQLAGLGASNVRDGAALVIDNSSGDVLAYVGSAGPGSSAAAVDGVRAPRQAGSTLKPFLYELALERRYLTAASLLDDSPLNIDTASGIYYPQDYDHDYKGLVSVRTALGGSLNVPAVRTAMLVGVEAFADRLRRLGYTGVVQDGEFYGYALALGSAEVTLWEQAQAYRALAQGGKWSPLRVLVTDPEPDATPLLQSATSFIIADVLSDPSARAVTFGRDNALDTGYWSAVKTGTSKDMRDNWCIGFTRDFTVAVWVGNFEGDSMHEVSGVTGAAPVWREIMDALQDGRASPKPAAPTELQAEHVRFSSGVETPRREWLLNGTGPRRTVEAVPQREQGARISSPVNGTVIAMDPDIPADYQRVPIKVEGASDGLRLRLNDAPVGTADAPLLWSPNSGKYRLSLEDAAGHTVDEISFTVR